MTQPEEAEMFRLFDRLRGTKDVLELDDMQEAILQLEAKYSLGLTPSEDKGRLFEYIRFSTGQAQSVRADTGITREMFVSGLQRLSDMLFSLKKTGCSLQQMKVVLMAAFERFDTDGNGEIDLEELMAAGRHLGMDLQEEAAAELYSFLCPKSEVLTLETLTNERSEQEKWTEALERSMVQMRKKKGIDGIVVLASRVVKEFLSDGSVEQRVQRALAVAWDGIDDVCNIVDLGVDIAGLVVACGYIRTALEEAAESQSIGAVEWDTVLPFVTLVGLGLVNWAKEVDELVPRKMSEDEAQLYAQIFRELGFTQAQFRRLVHCPGFKWLKADAGEVLHYPDEEELRMLVRGTAEVRRPVPGTGLWANADLPAGSIIDETAFLHGRSLWGSETVVAKESSFFACWGHDELRKCLAQDRELSLRFDGLLTETMPTSLRAKAQLLQKVPPASRPVSTDDSGLQSKVLHMFELLDTDSDGVVSEEEFREFGTTLSQSMSSSVAADALKEIAVGVVTNNAVQLDAVSGLLPTICSELSLGEGESASKRLFSYLDSNGDGVLSVAEFKERLTDLQGCTSSLRDVSIQDLESIMFRAFSQFDVDNDGVIDEKEFVMVAEKLNLPLSHGQMRQLFSYFDIDSDGSINYTEWEAGAGAKLSWEQALAQSLEEQADRRGLGEFRSLMEDLMAILSGPGELGAKLNRFVAKVLEASDALADVVSALADASSTGVALVGIWCELSGVSSLEDIGDIDIAPFLIFVASFGILAVRRKAEGDISDLKEEEAVLYVTGFEKEGFKVTEFQKLLKYGNVRWETFEEGDEVVGSEDSLKIITSGSCHVSHGGMTSFAIAERGAVLGAANFLNIDVVQAAHASGPVATAALDLGALRRQLKHDESLLARLRRLAEKSMVNALLDSEFH